MVIYIKIISSPLFQLLNLDRCKIQQLTLFLKKKTAEQSQIT
jgi:hypothetical protein